jgi:ABC-type transport system involved in multi-copper enzyme maturation permease subunit
VTRELVIGLKPVWLIGVGAVVGLIGIALLFLLLVVIHRRSAVAMWDILCEKLVLPVLIVAVLLGLFSIGMTISDSLGGRFFDRKKDSLLSLARLASVGTQNIEVDVPPDALDQKILLDIPTGELKTISLSSSQPLSVGVNLPPIEASIEKHERFEVLPDGPFKWTRSPEATGPLRKAVNALYIANESDAVADLKIQVETTVVVPEARLIIYTAGGLLLYITAYLLLQWIFPKIAAVTFTTGKEAVSQPLFRMTTVLGSFLIVLFVFVPYFTFGDDIKMYKEACLQVIMLLSMFLAIWTASVSVADEIEGRTALTVLSKPIGRSQFILGKFIGIASALALLFLLLGTLFVICISYKVAYDARESANFYVTWQDSSSEIMYAVPGLILAFMESAVLASISVAISTRLSILANLIICMGIYVVGHLLPLFVQSSVGEFAIVQFMGQLSATVLPVLEHFNIYGAIAAGEQVPLSYIAWVGGYSLVYIAIAMLLALALFDDRDLA